MSAPAKDRQDALAESMLHRIGLLRFLHRFLWLLVFYLFVWGAVILVLRFAYDVPRPPLAWGAAGIPLLALLSFLIEWSRRPSVAQARAFLDSKNECGGLLMARGMPGEEAWKDQMATLSSPRLRLKTGSVSLCLVMAVGFLAAGLLLPQKLIQQQFESPLQIDQVVEELASDIEELEQADLLDEEKATELTEQLNNIEAAAEGTDPMKTWEALDHLEKVIEDSKQEALEQQMAELEDISKAEAMASTLEQLAGESDGKNGESEAQDISEGMEELSRMMENKEIERALSEAGVPNDILEKLKNDGRLTKEELQQMAEQLQQQQDKLMEQFQNLLNQKQINQKQMGDCQGACENGRQGAQQALQDFLRKAGQGDQPGQNGGQGEENGEGKCDGRKPWNKYDWGLNRGPGHSPLDYLNNTDSKDTRFDPKILTAREIQNLKDSKLIGIKSTAPGESEGPAPTSSGALTGTEAGSGAANTQRIYPRHRKPVQRYFEREQPPGN